MSGSLKVAVIGAGPAGIYASDILAKSDLDVSIDLFERLPAPYGLVRYGVAPDHPRIKQIIVALFRILQRGDIRLFANVEVGRDNIRKANRSYIRWDTPPHRPLTKNGCIAGITFCGTVFPYLLLFGTTGTAKYSYPKW